MLAVKTKAPAFSLPDQTGKKHQLADYQGQWVLLYFYPRDNTPGCTKEACSLRDAWSQLKKLGLQVLGVSADSVERHQGFADKYQLPFPLLADPDKQVIEAYQARGAIGAKRVSYLINPQGMIVKVYAKVKPAEHAAQVLNDLKKILSDS